MSSSDTAAITAGAAQWAKRMKLALVESGMRQEDLAAALRLTPGTLSRILSGRRPPKLEHIRAIAEILDVPAGEAAALAVGANDRAADSRMEVLDLKQQVTVLKSETDRLSLNAASPTSTVVEAALRHSFGVSVWPVKEGPTVEVQFDAAHRIRVVVPDSELHRADGTPNGFEAQGIVESRLRPLLPPEIVFAGRRTREDFPHDPSLPESRTALLSVPIYSAPRHPGPRPVPLSEKATSILVVALTPHAWATSFGATLARSLDWGYDTTRAAGAVDRPWVPADTVSRLREREGLRTAELARLLEEPPRRFVVSHTFRGLRNSEEAGVSQRRPNALIERLTEGAPVPFVIFLHETDDALEFHLSETRFVDREPGEVRAELREQGSRLRELLLPLQQRRAAAVHSVMSPWPVTPDTATGDGPRQELPEIERRQLQWQRTARDVLAVRNLLVAWAGFGPAAIRESLAERILAYANPPGVRS